MSEKPDKKASEAGPAAGESEKAGKGGLLQKTPVLMAIVMLVEAGVLIGGIKFLGGGAQHAAADEAGAVDEHGQPKAAEGDKHKKLVELPVIEFRATNKVSGRTLLFDVAVFASVTGDHEEAAKKTLADRKALITDRIRTIIAQSDPEKLGGGAEPGLETLRRQIKYQLDEIVGEGMVDEVLIPRCIPFRADF